MEYRKLGSSGLSVSPLAFGAWQLGDPAYWGADPEAEAGRAVLAALDAGINLFDSAELYGAGESERVLGRLLGNRRDDVLVATKVSPQNCAPDKLRVACEASLERLGTDRIDLYQVHWPCREIPFETTYAELERLREEGKIRAIGVSNFGARDLADWMTRGTCVSNQLGYNLAFRAIEDDIVPACQRFGVGILVYMPLLQGVLTHRWRSADGIPQSRRRTRHFAASRPGVRHGEAGCEALLFDALAALEGVAGDLGCRPADLAIAWAMARPGVTSVLVGARNAAQLTHNLAARDVPLDARTIARIDAITAPLKVHFGGNADMWCGALESRIR